MVEICIEKLSPPSDRIYDYKILDVFNDACKVFNLRPSDVRSKSREQKYVFCRYIISYVGRSLLGDKLLDIAELLGFEDHSSVIYCVKRAEDWIGVKDPLFMRSWDKYTMESKVWRAYHAKKA